jgi:GTPase SAR1 family protein
LVRSKTGSHPGQFPRGDLILLAFSLTSADNISGLFKQNIKTTTESVTIFDCLDTLQKLHSWQALAQERMPHSPIILVGCKADLHHEDQTYEKAKVLAFFTLSSYLICFTNGFSISGFCGQL